MVNRWALARYRTFWAALVMVGEAVEDARKVALRLEDSGGVPEGWRVASGEEIARATRRVDGVLGELCREAQRWEAELISREWRV